MKTNSNARLHEQVCNSCKRNALAIDNIDPNGDNAVLVRFFCQNCQAFYSERYLVSNDGKQNFIKALVKWCSRMPEQYNIAPESVPVLWEDPKAMMTDLKIQAGNILMGADIKKERLKALRDAERSK